jgi:SAM-dependent methyltransferase
MPSGNAGCGDIAPQLAPIRDYYAGKVARHGPTPLGVDWPCLPTQELRFAQLLQLCDFSAPFSLNDLGCGYGALLALLGRKHRGKPVDYLGIDVSEPMIRHARARWRRRLHAAFVVADRCPRVADYGVASGIFNVKLDQPLSAWEALVARTLGDLHQHSRRGFAVNFLLPAPRGSARVPQLYRAPVSRWTRHCETVLDCNVTVLADYGLQEYTLIAEPRSEARQLRRAR